MSNLESIFVREFKNSVREVGYKDIFKIPLPECSKDWKVSGTELYAIKGIEAPYYSTLNKTIVKRLPRDKEAKRRVIDKVTRSFKVDEEGKYVYEDYKVPTGSVVVISDMQIELPYQMYVKPKDGYGYIDYVMGKDGIEYMYVLPKTVLYKINQTALVLSVKDMKNFTGMGYTSWTSGKIFLHIIPYSPSSKYTGSKVLETKYSLNYNEEVNEIVKFWQEAGVIPNITLCQLQDDTNLCLKPTTVGYEDYMPVEPLPLSDKEIYGAEEES